MKDLLKKITVPILSFKITWGNKRMKVETLKVGGGFTLISSRKPFNKDEVLNHPEVKAFTEFAKNYLDAIYKEAVSDLSPSEKDEFDSWWNRKSNNTHFSKKANSAVLWAIGQGAG